MKIVGRTGIKQVRSIWRGMFGVPDWEVNEIIRGGYDLQFERGNEYMFIPNNQINNSIVSISKETFWDKFSKRKPYHLYYFTWTPVRKGE